MRFSKFEALSKLLLKQLVTIYIFGNINEKKKKWKCWTFRLLCDALTYLKLITFRKKINKSSQRLFINDIVHIKTVRIPISLLFYGDNNGLHSIAGPARTTWINCPGNRQRAAHEKVKNRKCHWRTPNGFSPLRLNWRVCA